MGGEARPASPQQCRKAYVLPSTRTSVNLDSAANLSMSVPLVGDLMEQQNVLRGERGILEKGVTPVHLEKMLRFLPRYQDRAAAQLLEDGFEEEDGAGTSGNCH